MAQRSAVGGADGPLLVAQTEYGWWSSRSTVGGANGARRERGQSTDGARLGRGQGAVRARSERSRSAVGGADGVRLVAQTERGWGAVRARSECGQSAVGRSGMDGEKNCRGGGRTGNNLNCCCFPERGSSAGGCRGREDQRAETHFPWPYGLTISTGWTLDLSSGAVRYLVREKSMDFTSMQRMFWFQAVR